MQLDLHAVAPHWKAPHDALVGGLQLPAPSHVVAWVSNSPLHDAGAPHASDAEAYLHAIDELPSHAPLHAAPLFVHGVRRPCGAPLATVVHAPTWPATSHAWHWPEQLPSQQTPSTQLPDAQTEPFAQSAPFDSVLPQMNSFESQCCPTTQSASEPHVDRHPDASSLQVKAPHDDVVAAGQWPAPSQTVAFVWRFAAQLCAPQLVPEVA